MICNVEKCDKNVYARGLCITHYRYMRRYGSTNVPQKEYSVCCVDGCEEIAKVRCRCPRHYEHWRRKERKDVLCSVDGCNNPLHAKGYCQKHYLRYKQHGTIDIPNNVSTLANMEWRTISGFPHYEVSEYGHVRVAHSFGSREAGYLLTPTLHHKGYKVYSLISEDGVKSQTSMHRLVAIAFIGEQPCDEAYHVCHNDGDKSNNHYTNLRWDTPQGNADDTKRHGRTAKGTRNVNNKLTESDVRNIRKSYTGDKGQLAHLGRKYNVTPQTIASIVHNETWKHVM